MTSIIVCPLHDVEAVIRIRQPSHIISLLSPSAAATEFDGFTGQRLELRFNDISEEREGLTAPSSEHVERILGFADGAEGSDPVLIHCWAGVSRSTAAALIVATQRNPEGAYSIANHLRNAAPYATPNSLMIAHADRILKQSGKLVDAAKSIGRGSDTSWGAVFEIRTELRLVTKLKGAFPDHW